VSDAGDIEDLVARFRSRRLPHAEWTHHAHLAVGAWYVARFGAEEALRRLRDDIRALNDAHGTANTDDGGYHETITRAYVVLLEEFLAGCPADLTLAQRIQRLLAGPVADRQALAKFWSRERLESVQARRGWVEPDRAPLSMATPAG
jgi:hypothetical protein